MLLRHTYAFSCMLHAKEKVGRPPQAEGLAGARMQGLQPGLVVARELDRPQLARCGRHCARCRPPRLTCIKPHEGWVATL